MLPVFVLLVLGIVEFGRAMMVGQLLSNGARYGTQQAIEDGASNAGVAQDVRDFLSPSLKIPGCDIDVAIDVEAGPGNADPQNDLSRARPQDLVTVTVRVPFDRVSYLAGHFLSGTDLEGQCSLRRE